METWNPLTDHQAEAEIRSRVINKAFIMFIHPYQKIGITSQAVREMIKEEKKNLIRKMVYTSVQLEKMYPIIITVGFKGTKDLPHLFKIIIDTGEKTEVNAFGKEDYDSYRTTNAESQHRSDEANEERPAVVIRLYDDELAT